MKETYSKFVPHIVRSSISGEVWVEGIQSNTVQCGVGGLQHGWVTPNAAKLISVARFAIYHNKVAQTGLVFVSYSVQILVVLFF
jgi:hypothetical protein